MAERQCTYAAGKLLIAGEVTSAGKATYQGACHTVHKVGKKQCDHAAGKGLAAGCCHLSGNEASCGNSACDP